VTNTSATQIHQNKHAITRLSLIFVEKNMQTIEPFSRWDKLYKASEDPLSPYFGEQHDALICRDTIYNHYIHPLWESFGSKTLYLKILFTNYEKQYTIIEMLGEWNDCLYNDIMYLKRNIIEHLEEKGIHKFILIGENVLNFHYSDDSYYEDWFNDVEDGWIVAINFREHVLHEFDKINLNYYLLYGGRFNEVKWRITTPQKLFEAIDHLAGHALNP